MEGFLVGLGVLAFVFAPSALLSSLAVFVESAVPEISEEAEESEEAVFSFEIGLFGGA